MSQALIDELNRENICTHFVLPLLKLSKFNFNCSGFINCYITTDLKKVVVKIADRVLLSRIVLNHPDFFAIYEDTDGYFLVVFSIRDKWAEDLKKFSEGKFSQFSDQAKQYIFRYSKLPRNVMNGNKIPVTDGRLLALEKHEAMRVMWKKRLYENTGRAIDDAELYLPDEYISSPGKESFVILKNLKRIREAQ